MRRRFAALAVSALLAGGTVAVTVPVTSATAATVTCDPAHMRQQIAQLKAKAARLKHEGEYAAAKRTLDQANSLQRKLDACLAAEDNAAKPFPR
ncbi:hypothetical protein [Streptantibioticus cattleyicolor]|uniref:Uncharacterized protein n=1 Tax=Streptantibioticus cattleyicolor (strain ATCC 35852 / DSM 46488 / JCM 4925 / NBRC 14057 / NRRL 8057) TaxID=1003195 RepID=F8JJD2_STREN|nr:hypothetical protein [Streptantibioticus cattleyicolor]AEW98750.1 hypothetical protein SCATT_p05570 [Streptantibioticus cattleyicolor NRRL 8057 = DSM 46488]CCB72198.1 conserved exported protein of unknown function [Streptantibioticus cattleyicolor NRRL 8057 = DSM 46488]